MFRIADFIGDFKWNVGKITLQTSSVLQIRPFDGTRAYLAIGNPNNQVLVISPSPQLDTSGGPIVVPVNSTYEIYWERHGEITCEAWYGFAKGMITPIQWLEVLWLPSGSIPTSLP